MRRAARIDYNQISIVTALRQIPGVTVEVGHDDILVGFRKKTFWFELKNADAVNKRGEIHKGSLKPSQQQLLDNWKGHYRVAWNLDQILVEIGINRENNST